MKTFEEWEREPKARPPKDLYSLGVTDIYEIREEAWNARDDDFADLQHQLEPSPCGVEGHRRADWVELGIVAIGDEMYYCSLCRREQEIRREERERCARIAELEILNTQPGIFTTAMRIRALHDEDGKKSK